MERAITKEPDIYTLVWFPEPLDNGWFSLRW